LDIVDPALGAVVVVPNLLLDVANRQKGDDFRFTGSEQCLRAPQP